MCFAAKFDCMLALEEEEVEIEPYIQRKVLPLLVTVVDIYRIRMFFLSSLLRVMRFLMLSLFVGQNILADTESYDWLDGEEQDVVQLLLSAIIEVVK
jgi:hypothetical protein